MVAIRRKPFFSDVLKHSHSVAPRRLDDESAVWIAGIDPGHSSPMALVAAEVTRSGRVHVSYASQLIESRFETSAELLDEATGGACVLLGCDPIMRCSSLQTGRTDLHWWRARGFDPRVYPMGFHERLQVVRRWLREPPLRGGITISTEAELLYDALSSYACVCPPGQLATCFTPRVSHVFDAFSYLLLRAWDAHASGVFGTDGLPHGHCVA